MVVLAAVVGSGAGLRTVSGGSVFAVGEASDA